MKAERIITSLGCASLTIGLFNPLQAIALDNEVTAIPENSNQPSLIDETSMPEEAPAEPSPSPVEDQELDGAKASLESKIADAEGHDISVDSTTEDKTVPESKVKDAKTDVINDYTNQESELQNLIDSKKQNQTNYLKSMKEKLSSLLGEKQTEGWNVEALSKTLGISQDFFERLEAGTVSDEEFKQVYARLEGLTLTTAYTPTEEEKITNPQEVIVKYKNGETDFKRLEVNVPFTYRHIFKDARTGKFIDVRFTPTAMKDSSHNFAALTGNEAYVSLSNDQGNTSPDVMRSFNPLNNMMFCYTIKDRNGKYSIPPTIIFKVEFLDSEANSALMAANPENPSVINELGKETFVAINPLLLFTDIDGGQSVKLMEVEDAAGQKISFKDLSKNENGSYDHNNIVLLGPAEANHTTVSWSNNAVNDVNYFKINSSANASTNDYRGAWFLSTPHQDIRSFTYAFFPGSWNSALQGLGLMTNVTEEEGDYRLPTVIQPHYNARFYNLYSTPDPIDNSIHVSDPGTEEQPVVPETSPVEEEAAVNNEAESPTSNTSDTSIHEAKVKVSVKKVAAKALPQTSDLGIGFSLWMAFAGALISITRFFLKKDA